MQPIADKVHYLENAGWRFDAVANAWCDPTEPSHYYPLLDAYEIQLCRDGITNGDE